MNIFIKQQDQYNALLDTITGKEILLGIENANFKNRPDYFYGSLSTQDKYFVTKYVLHEAVCLIKQDGIRRSVNLDINQLANPMIIKYLLSCSAKTKSLICLEIIENYKAEEDLKNKILFNMKLLDHQGFILSLDDFGSGYSNYNRLVDFPYFKEIKVDKSLIKSRESHQIFLILQRIFNYCIQRKIKIVFEGIETNEEIMWINKYFFNETIISFQGYLLDYPKRVSKNKSCIF